MATMDIDAEDALLKKVASDGSMDFSAWPALLPKLVSRIEKAARNDFPIPVIPPPQPVVRPPSPRFLAPLPSSDPIEPTASEGVSSQETNKENANPCSNATPAASSTGPAPQLLEPGALPTPIAMLLDEITSTITGNFQTYPPHTIQRLAELVLKPKQHYRNLPAYLHALDRVVHVTSGANIYPLPPAIPEPAAMSRLANGHGGGGTSSGLSINSTAANNIGSDEALGGALLTPIPWLARRANGEDGSSDVESSSPVSSGLSPTQGRHTSPQGQSSQHRQGGNSDRQMETESTETIEGPNGMGRIETVSVSITNGIPSLTSVSRGITQGELLRQEQRAGVVPVSQLARQGHAAASGASHLSAGGPGASAGPGTTAGPASSTEEDAAMTEDADEEVPHARGPEEIGAADTGPLDPNVTFHANASGSIEMQGIDVEAAVGRRGEGTHKSPEPTTAEPLGTNPEAAVSQSPKREADDSPEVGSSKRLKEDDSPEDPSDTAATAEVPEKDAEGDVIIGDLASQGGETIAQGDGEAGGDAKGQDGQEPAEGKGKETSEGGEGAQEGTDA